MNRVARKPAYTYITARLILLFNFNANLKILFPRLSHSVVISMFWANQLYSFYANNI